MLAVFNGGHSSPQASHEKEAFRYVLNVYEMLATMVTLDALELDTWRTYWRSTTIRDWDRLKKFVDSERDNHGNVLYCETEKIVDKFRKEA